LATGAFGTDTLAAWAFGPGTLAGAAARAGPRAAGDDRRVAAAGFLALRLEPEVVFFDF